MRGQLSAIVSISLFAAGASTGLAQEGFPLDGTWRGALGASADTARNIVMIMKWDGQNITGMINPGPNSIAFARAALDPSDWTVRIEAEPAEGEAIVFEGTLRDIGSYNRYIEGTWTQAGEAQNFRLTRE